MKHRLEILRMIIVGTMLFAIVGCGMTRVGHPAKAGKPIDEKKPEVVGELPEELEAELSTTKETIDKIRTSFETLILKSLEFDNGSNELEDINEGSTDISSESSDTLVFDIPAVIQTDLTNIERAQINSLPKEKRQEIAKENCSSILPDFSEFQSDYKSKYQQGWDASALSAESQKFIDSYKSKKNSYWECSIKNFKGYFKQINEESGITTSAPSSNQEPATHGNTTTNQNSRGSGSNVDTDSTNSENQSGTDSQDTTEITEETANNGTETTSSENESSSNETDTTGTDTNTGNTDTTTNTGNDSLCTYRAVQELDPTSPDYASQLQELFSKPCVD